MPHAPGPRSEPQGEAPLPPVRTRHTPPPEVADATSLVAPFVPSQSAAPQPFPASGAEPWLELTTTPTAEPELTAFAAPPDEVPLAADSDGPTMPWEEYLEIEPTPEAPEPTPDAILSEWGTVPSPAEPDWNAAMPPAAGEAAPPWGEAEATSAPPAFPLDAFIVPPDAARPAGMAADHRELADALAGRLEALAARLRVEGFDPLLEPVPDARPIDRLLAAILAGYLSH